LDEEEEEEEEEVRERRLLTFFLSISSLEFVFFCISMWFCMEASTSPRLDGTSSFDTAVWGLGFRV